MNAILIQTFPKYKELAFYTKSKIEQFWERHPRIYLCGCVGSHDAGWLECSNEKASWIRTLLLATIELEEKGVKTIYLILDDHPPAGKCNASFLNETLPQWMIETGATNIGLRGKGQLTKIPTQKGPHHGLLKELVTYRGIFSLHPSLWNVQALRRICEELILHLDEESQTPWLFEKRGPTLPALEPEIKSNTFVIDGAKFTRRKFRLYLKRLIYFSTRPFNLNLNEAICGLWTLYEGPYPVLFGGLMRGGVINRYLDRRIIQLFLEHSYDSKEILAKID